MTDTSPAAPRRRARSRRTEPRPYWVERPRLENPPPSLDDDDPAVVASRLLVDAGTLCSALRAPLRALGIDLRLARLLLAFPPSPAPFRVANLAWRLGMTTGGTSGLVDDAEQRALVDKHYDLNDRRGTRVRLTREGLALRAAVYDIIRAGVSTQRPPLRAYGIRAYLDGIRPPGGRRGSRGP